jgi:hypothetical protein
LASNRTARESSATSQQPLLVLLGDSYQRDGVGFLETLAEIVLDGLVRPQDDG